MSTMPECKRAESLPAQKDSAYRGIVETSVFAHWLRTGHMADSEALIDLVERKFNPYHAADGRFTSPPGVTVSYGSATSSAAAYSGNASGTSQRRTQVDRRRRTSGRASAAPASSGSGFRSRFVRDAVSETTSTADTYFELNKRQRYLDKLRDEAGPNADPQIIADFEDFQNRLNANRKILDERAKIADRNTLEVLRAGLAPVDVGAGLANIASGRSEFRDYVAVAGAVPIAGSVGKFARIGKVSAPNVHMGKQGKHIVGHQSYIAGKSILHADPLVLAQRAGTGVPVGRVPRGQPGFKERVDFGEVIGEYVGKGKSMPTTNGILVYDKTGAIHIIPARPKP